MFMKNKIRESQPMYEVSITLKEMTIMLMMDGVELLRYASLHFLEYFLWQLLCIVLYTKASHNLHVWVHQIPVCFQMSYKNPLISTQCKPKKGK